MLYIFLKNIIESLTANYHCPDCGNKTNQDAINITAISSRGIDIHLICSVCGIHSQLSAEVNTMTAELSSNENGHKLFEEFIKSGENINNLIVTNDNIKKKGINAADIAKMGEDVQKAKTIEDLMS